MKKIKEFILKWMIKSLHKKDSNKNGVVEINIHFDIKTKKIFLKEIK